MPAIKSNGGNQQDKKRAFSVQGKPAVNGDGGGRTFLSVSPALPVLHAGGAPAAAATPGAPAAMGAHRAPRLARRSHSSVGAVSVSGPATATATAGGAAGAGAEGADDGELQATHDGRLQVARTVREKEKNPDRISLDRRGLTTVPMMPGESRVRLLSLQHNLISRMDSLSAAGLTLSRLVFLDIYDNQVDRISGLDCLDNLRVLLMGKNRIRKIEGLRRQTRLEVLDLHGNQISSIQGLSFLCELKVLNLAGNQIRTVGATDLQGLRNLQELNLRRNRLRKLLGFGDTPHLVKLFLSNNELSCVEDMYSVAKSSHLREVTIDGNPVAQGGDCVSFLVSYLPSLVTLSNLQITDPVRKAAMSWRSNKEAASSLFLQLGAGEPEGSKREEVIFNARTNWELLRSQSYCGPAPGSGRSGLGQQQQRPGTAGTAATTSAMATAGATADAEAEDRAEDKTGRGLGRSGVGSAGGAAAPKQTGGGVVGPSARVVNMLDRHHTDGKRRGPVRRTASQDTDTSSTNTSNSVEFFRLPPILAPLLGFPEEKQAGEDGHELPPGGQPPGAGAGAPPPAGRRPRRCDSLSSVEPNVDTSLSSLSGSSGGEDDSDSDDELAAPAVPAAPTAPVEVQRTKSATPHRRPSPMYKPSPPRASTARPKPQPGTAGTAGRALTVGAAGVLGPVAAPVSVPPTPPVVPAGPVPAAPPAGHGANGTAQGKTREQGGDYLVEISGRYLNVYGQGALRFIDRPWNPVKAADVTIVRFNYINFNGLTTVLGRLKQRFPNAEHFIFRENNLACLGQLNALADIQGLTSLSVEEEGNPIVVKQWQSYAIYRLAHWGLRTINDVEVTEEMMAAAAAEFRGLSDLVLWSLPDSLLQPLLSRLRLDGSRGHSHGPGLSQQQLQQQHLSARQWLWTADPALRTVVGKEALQWRRTALTPDDLVWRHKGRVQLGALLDVAVAAVVKLRMLEAKWPGVLQELVRDTLVDHSHLHAYMKKCMANLQRL